MTSKISENGISILESLPNEPGKRSNSDTNVILQIYSSQKTEKATNVFSVTMIDLHQKYSGFLMKYPQDDKPNVGDIIHIHKVSIAFLNKDKTKIFYLREFETIAKNMPFVKSPDSLENCSKKKFLEKENEKKNEYDENSYNEKNYINQKTKNGDFDDSNCLKLSNVTTFSKNLHFYVKCLKKTEIKHYNSKNGPGQLFNIIICDVDGFEMSCTAFNNTVDKLYNLLTEGKIYEIKGGFVKINDKKYSSVKSDYRITFDEKTIINEVPDNGSFRESQCSFVKINEINDMSQGNIIDIIGYVIEVSELKTLNTKRGEMIIRNIIIGDDSGYKINITAWKPFCDIEIPINEIIAFKNLRINEYNGIKKLSSVDTTSILLNVKEYYNEVNAINKYLQEQNDFKELYLNNNTIDISGPVEISYLKDILDDNYLLDDQNRNTIKIRAHLDYMNHSEKNYYPGCFDCKKKLSQDQDGWFCQTCNKKFNEPKYYYTINCKVRDLTGESWIEMFGDTGSKFLGMSVDEYKEMIINNDQSKINEISKKIDFKEYIFIGKVKITTYNNISKKKISVYRCEEINQKIESEKLIKFFSTILI